MFSTRGRRVLPRPTARHPRYIPQLERIEDRLAPGQVFALFTDPLDGPLPALLPTDEEERDTTASLARSLEGQGIPRLGANLGTIEVAGPGLQQIGTSVHHTVGAPSVVASQVEALTQVVGSLDGTALEGTGIQDGMNVTLEGTSIQDGTNVTLEGTLEVLHGTKLDGTGEHYFYLNTGNGQIPLADDEVLDDLESGSVLRVQGTMQDGTLVPDPNGITVQQAPPPGQADPEGEGGATIQSVFRPILVINVNFQDRQTQPWTITSAYNVFNGPNGVSPWMYEMSYGNVEMWADVIGWFTIASSYTTCSSGTWSTQAQNAARAAGYEPNNYTHVVIAFPNVPSCGWSGLGQVPGRITWLNNAMNLGVAAHELGHNLGLSHSNQHRCTTGPLDGICSTIQYGDRYDAMGQAGTRALFHAAYRAGRGYIPAWDRIEVNSSWGEAYVEINSAAAWEGPRVVQVRRTGRSDSLFLEWREAVGFDSVLTSYLNSYDGLMVYLGTNMSSQSIVDYRYWTTTSNDAPIPIGEVLYDNVGRVGIYPYAREFGITYIHIFYW